MTPSGTPRTSWRANPRPSALRRGIGLVAMSVLLGLTLTGVPAAGTGVGSPREPLADADDPAALAALDRAARAETVVGFRARAFVTTWHPDASGRRVAGSDRFEVENLPGKGTVVAGRGRRGHLVPLRSTAPLRVSARALAESHTLRLVGPATAVGRSAVEVEAVRRDGTLGARLLIDQESGLLLRRELFDVRGEPARVSAYSSLELLAPHEIDTGAGTEDGTPLPPPLAVPAARAVPARAYATVAAAGWDCCAERLPGGYTLRTVRRTANALHLLYSDGLVNASIFEQRGILRESALDGFTRRQDERGVVHVRYGVTSYAVWSHAGTVYTVACDTPAGLDAIVTAYAQRGGSGEEGVGARIGRGLGRLFSWVNPLDAGSGR